MATPKRTASVGSALGRRGSERLPRAGSISSSSQSQSSAALLSLEYDAELAASGDLGVALRSASAPWPAHGKEPAGLPFHEMALRQRGLMNDPDDDAAAAAAAAACAAAASAAADANGSSGSGAGDDDDQPPPGVSWSKAKPSAGGAAGASSAGGRRKKSGSKKDRRVDCYALLGLQNERWLANADAIKQAYRRAALEHHPDKALAAMGPGALDDPKAKVRVEEHFKLVQRAYETLSDPAKRREFDSTDAFDDTLPADCAPCDFFAVFGPAFRRNARWSAAPGGAPAPDLGAPDAGWDDVQAFYDYWFAFRSWREFPHEDEEDLEGADGREHRRFLERINSKLREKGKKEEGRRLREFVDNAYRLDPRVVARREAERRERDGAKAAREAAKAAKEGAERRAKEEADARAAADEAERLRAAAEAKATREVERRALKKMRQRLRALCSGQGGGGGGGGGGAAGTGAAGGGGGTNGGNNSSTSGGGGGGAAPTTKDEEAAAMAAATGGKRLLPEDDVERLCGALDAARLCAACDAAMAALAAGTGPDGARAALADALDGVGRKAGEEAAAREATLRGTAAALDSAASREHEKKVAAMREWTAEELRLLDKAAAKYPTGTPRRWEQVSAYVRTRTLEDVLLMVKEKGGASATRARQQEDWKGNAKRRAEVTSAADLREEAFTDVAVGPEPAWEEAAWGGGGEEEEGEEKEQPTQTRPPAKAANGGGGAAAAAAAAKVPAAAPAAAAAPPAAAPASPPSAAAAPAAPPAADWSEAQELALVKALKVVPKDAAPAAGGKAAAGGDGGGADRWERVAALVPGKTKAQCARRFKEIKGAFKAAKEAAAASGK